MTIGERIKARREALGLSQEQLAKKVGYTSGSSINKIEQGKQGLTRAKLKEVADALQTTPSYIMGWSQITPNAAEAWLSTREEWEERKAIIDQLNNDDDRRMLAYWAATADIEKVKAIITLIEAHK